MRKDCVWNEDRIREMKRTGECRFPSNSLNGTRLLSFVEESLLSIGLLRVLNLTYQITPPASILSDVFVHDIPEH